MKKTTQPPEAEGAREGGGKNTTNLSTEVQVLKTDTGNTD